MIHFMVITQKFGQLQAHTYEVNRVRESQEDVAFVICGLDSSLLATVHGVFCQASSYALIWLEIWRIVKGSINFIRFVAVYWINHNSNSLKCIAFIRFIYSTHLRERTLYHFCSQWIFVRPSFYSSEFSVKSYIYSWWLVATLTSSRDVKAFSCSTSVIMVRIISEVRGYASIRCYDIYFGSEEWWGIDVMI